MQRLLIEEYATSTVDFRRSYVLLLADGETAADYATEIAEIEWVQTQDRFDVWDDLTESEYVSESALDEYEVIGTDLDAINAELAELAAENQYLGVLGQDGEVKP